MLKDPESPTRIIKKRKQYDPDSLMAAYKAVKDSSISVNAAAKQYGVPLTTLRDRVDGRIGMEATRPGPPLLMGKDDEAEIVHFLHTMARYGYRYTRQELADIATDQAVSKGKKSPQSNALTTKWVDNFISRWPGVKDVGCKFRNKSDAERTVRTYFDEIKKIIDKFNLMEKNNRIFNVMEINLSTDHNVQHPTNSKGHQFKTVNSSNTTLIACASVSGRVLAPFIVFQASQLRPEMMTRVPSNVNASISETGNCSPQIFKRYLNEHFLPQSQRLDNDPILVLMDGSKSHVFVGMNEWGKANNVIFSFIPAHTTHLLQPLEVECAEAVRKRYESICQRHLKPQALPSVNRNSIGELACQAYVRSMTRQVITHSFKKAGVFPEISSDDSGDDLDSESCHSSFRSDDSNEDPEEVVFTEDLVVGQNQEVTEEEVVTSNEIVLDEEGQAEEVVLTSDGQLVMKQNSNIGEGHLVIHGGEIFVNSGEHGLSHLQLVQAIANEDNSITVKPDPDDYSLGIKPDPDRLDSLNDSFTDHNRIFGSPSLDFGSSSNFSITVGHGALDCDMDSSELIEVKQEPGTSNDSDLDFDYECAPSCARTLPISYLVKRQSNNEKRRHSVLLQQVLDIIQN